MKLTKEQIDRIEMYVIQSRITIPSLRDDLIDHLCCEIELRAQDGNDFEKCFEAAVRVLAPSGLYAIEQETQFLLQPNKVIMKKLLYLIGLASAISMTMGLMFKIMHMPGADQLINYGFFAFVFVFLPVIFVRKLGKASQFSGVEKLKAIFGIVSAVGMLLSIVTKIRMEIDMATILLFCTTAIFCFGFLPLHFYEMYRKSLREAN
ncbi:MAG TPA: hypothetical protein VGD65_03385 [Chryseosolibacter sp.]